ncbi:MAG: hypothetical protein AAGB19_00550 [Cyanobacteria bacterium P01_F01_bin.3]
MLSSAFVLLLIDRYLRHQPLLTLSTLPLMGKVTLIGARLERDWGDRTLDHQHLGGNQPIEKASGNLA